MNLTERFLSYVAFPTTSDEHSETSPSTDGQRSLGLHLVEELRAMGIRDAHQDEHGYVYATIPACRAQRQPVIGFIAHLDTSPDCSGEHISPAVVLYEGGDLTLNEEKQIVLREAEFPVLRRHVGKHLIVTDGQTLLGADDKAGIAEIMDMTERLLESDRPHGEIRIAFTPDEEIGRGADRFDVTGFGCDFAYTVDGGTLGELEYENFNAAAGLVLVHGVGIHPGSAKGKMKNAASLAMEFERRLPPAQRPECTEGYEGFFHLTALSGNVEEAQLHYIIRDHDRKKFEEKKALFHQLAAELCDEFGAGTFEAVTKDSYYNMKEQIQPHMEIVRRAERALRRLGVPSKTVPIRGGTDGARLSFLGLPCPNLCTGGENFHGRYEFVPMEDMAICADMLMRIACGD
ncbi:MAG: peptidase T [Oscillospiraceae bacterium]|nr:peptidase T [Oscillospiraceae bacterium]